MRRSPRFGPLLDEWHTRSSGDFLAEPRQTLAAIILFDQFPRNMFRGQARAFATDGLALELAHEAVEREYDKALSPDERSFLYMPFQHSEDLLDQDRSVDLFARLGIDLNYQFAAKHRDMITRFGRFPARNEALGRTSTPDEAEAIAESKDW
jgi:uncharacterized protein (DUF924 family)